MGLKGNRYDVNQSILFYEDEHVLIRLEALLG